MSAAGERSRKAVLCYARTGSQWARREAQRVERGGDADSQKLGSRLAGLSALPNTPETRLLDRQGVDDFNVASGPPALLATSRTRGPK